MQTKTINVVTSVSNTINSRDVIVYFQRFIMEPSVHFRLDFYGVQFISRSAAQELNKLTSAQKGRVEIVNLNTELSAFLEAVRNSKRGKTTTDADRISINDI